MLSSKLNYLISSLRHSASACRRNCPSCGSTNSKLIIRKKLVTSLRRCNACSLQFRTPTTSSDENAAFYQEEYRQGFDSDVPSPDELKGLLESRFQNSPKNYDTYIQILKALNIPHGARILDFGCSWGYGTWQLQQAGYEMVGFEISRPRCSYAIEHLGINAYSDINDIPDGTFDVFFSAHVLEHVPSVADAVTSARKKLAGKGIFIAFTPNGAAAFRTANTPLWNNLWGQVHPNFLDDRFYLSQFEQPLLVSSPYDLPSITRQWTSPSREFNEVLDGEELMVAVTLT